MPRSFFTSGISRHATSRFVSIVSSQSNRRSGNGKAPFQMAMQLFVSLLSQVCSQGGKHQEIFLSTGGFFGADDVCETCNRHVAAAVLQDYDGIQKIRVPRGAVWSHSDVEWPGIRPQSNCHHGGEQVCGDTTRDFDSIDRGI
jgi:hypothetical protein